MGYVKNDIHWDITIHSKVSQRFSCMECMKAHATRLRIMTNHKNICLNSGKVKIIENGEQKITLAELEIAKQIKNGTKLSKEQASEILELMKNNKVDIYTTPSNTENISKNREQEIMEN